MKLAFHVSGSGGALVILHGLYGSLDNWRTLGRALSAHFKVYLVDQRNHGRSPHDPVHTYGMMCDDLLEFLVDHGINETLLLGYSMGGKTAMLFALRHPEKVGRLVVVDISPGDYSKEDIMPHVLSHQKIVSALQSIDPLLIRSRKEADIMLQSAIPQLQIRQFLLKNLKTEGEGNYRWTLNLDALSDHMDHLSASILSGDTEHLIPSPVTALFVKGEKSPYIREEDIGLIKKTFPQSRIVTIPKAGHWVHAEQPDLLLRTVLTFLHQDGI
jgi:esterase